MNAIVGSNLGGGDWCWVLIDEARWNQLKRISEEISGDEWDEKFHEYAEALTYHQEPDEQPLSWPEGCPPPEGKTIKRWFTQTRCIEDVDMSDIIGMLML